MINSLLFMMPGGMELIFILVPLIFWILTFYDVLNSDFQGNKKLVWMLSVFFFPLIGAILYWAFGRQQRLPGQN